MEIKTLDKLLDYINGLDEQEFDELDMTSLPTFGGAESENIRGVWSWDADRLLVRDGRNEFKIVNREEW